MIQFLFLSAIAHANPGAPELTAFLKRDSLVQAAVRQAASASGPRCVYQILSVAAVDSATTDFRARIDCDGGDSLGRVDVNGWYKEHQRVQELEISTHFAG